MHTNTCNILRLQLQLTCVQVVVPPLLKYLRQFESLEIKIRLLKILRDSLRDFLDNYCT